MRLHEFDLNLLVYLDALLTEKGVSRAAVRLGITQPAMSEALARLREYFKDKLLIHVTGRSMILTPLACSLVAPVREILLHVQAVAAATTDFVPAKSDRKFSIMASDYVYDVLLRRVLIRLSQDAPGIRIEVRRVTVSSWDEIKRADLDLLVTPYGYASEELPSEPLYEETITCVVWTRNRLVGDQVSLERYQEMGHVCRNMDGQIAEYDRWFMSRFGMRRRVEVLVPDFGMVLRAVEGTNRIATVHLRHARMYAKQFSLRVVRPPVVFPLLTEFLQWHQHQDRDPGLAWLRSYLRAAAVEI